MVPQKRCWWTRCSSVAMSLVAIVLTGTALPGCGSAVGAERVAAPLDYRNEYSAVKVFANSDARVNRQGRRTDAMECDFDPFDDDRLACIVVLVNGRRPMLPPCVVSYVIAVGDA